MEAQDTVTSSPSGKKSRNSSMPLDQGGGSASGVESQRNPIYPSQSPSGFQVNGDVSDPGMRNLEATENFGAKFQMPEAQTSDNFLTAPLEPGEGNGEKLPLDVQATVDAITHLVARIKANLESPEQQELEELLREGAAMLATHYKTISHLAAAQVSGMKAELQENPYRGLMTAIKVGMALSAVYSSSQKR